ncbi:MAG: uridine kinase [Anaerolineae bacterium]|jgi:uridine kinase
MDPVIIGVAGGTGSGKTTVAREVLKRAGTQKITLIQHDAYYKDLSNLPPSQRAMQNFDHPDALENPLLIRHLQELKAGQRVAVPVYDFTTHTRTAKTRLTGPNPIILLEGILIFADPELRQLMDVKIYVDTDPDIRFIRRLQRDISERGRTTESVIRQYLATVRPMHEEFVEPSKRFADIIIPEGGFNEVAMDMIAARIKTLLEEAE